jgi:hypothetical protein
MELLETALERFDLTTLAAGYGALGSQFLEIFTDQTSEGSVSLDGNLPYLFHQLVI